MSGPRFLPRRIREFLGSLGDSEQVQVTFGQSGLTSEKAIERMSNLPPSTKGVVVTKD